MFNSEDPPELAAERVAFEKWYSIDRNLKTRRRFSRHYETGAYIDPWARVAWRGWVAALKHSPSASKT